MKFETFRIFSKTVYATSYKVKQMIKLKCSLSDPYCVSKLLFTHTDHVNLHLCKYADNCVYMYMQITS